MNTLPLSAGLSRFVIPWTQLNWPLDWAWAFDHSGPLVLEIGFGNGAFLIEHAQKNPAYNHVGIERSWGSVQRLIKRLQASDTTNVRVLEGDAAWQLDHLFSPQTIQAIFINFSDPWPKTRHHRRRLIQPAFVATLAQRLVVGGTLTVATDHAGYAGWIAKVLQSQRELQSRFDTVSVHALTGRTPTKYERKALEQGRTIHYFVWHKPQVWPVVPTPEEKAGSMPNVLLHGEHDIDRLLAALSPTTWEDVHRGEAVRIRLEAVFKQQHGDGGLAEVVVVEGGFSQHIGVLLLPQDDGKVLLKPASLGYPRPTWGVKRAVWHLARTLLDQHPQLQVASSTVGRLTSEGGKPG